jgi:hypothetical protein
MKKTFVLVVLFVFPLVAYLFFASGVNNFGRLPVLTKNIGGLKDMDPAVSFEGHITILGFLGVKPARKREMSLTLIKRYTSHFMNSMNSRWSW